ncbi:YaaC family protein [Brevibacillus migulae]|uniref:YaaC family protein n=1 Tax=Brevibacillus migulae TaxID=1644114 RepID=UPI00106E3E91|nr:YaaC family protein [Brevibacillus migulae]
MRDAWEILRFLETEPTAREYLANSYESRGIEHPNRHAFSQCTRFVYTWRQARSYYEAATHADLLIRPLLLFYGCMQMIKGCILAIDPSYPSNSRMLQHGVTTRKMKKSPYRLLDDEVRPQKEGLFAHAAQLFKLFPLRERYKTDHLFASLAEMTPDYERIVGASPWLPITQKEKGSVLVFPASAQSQGPLAYSADTLCGYLNRLAPPDSVAFEVLDRDQITGQSFRLQGSLDQLAKHSLFSMTRHGDLYFWNGSESDLPLPKWATHYLLLYLLGILCRYETEWWGELVLSHTLSELILIERFLQLHSEQFPALICTQLSANSPHCLS